MVLKGGQTEIMQYLIRLLKLCVITRRISMNPFLHFHYTVLVYLIKRLSYEAVTLQ